MWTEITEQNDIIISNLKQLKRGTWNKPNKHGVEEMKNPYEHSRISTAFPFWKINSNHPTVGETTDTTMPKNDVFQQIFQL